MKNKKHKLTEMGLAITLIMAIINCAIDIKGT